MGDYNKIQLNTQMVFLKTHFGRRLKNSAKKQGLKLFM